jgi:hypothetical protein
MSPAERLLLEARLAGVRREAEALEQALGAPVTPPAVPQPMRKPPKARRPTQVVPPSADELSNVTPILERRVENAAMRKGAVKT